MEGADMAAANGSRERPIRGWWWAVAIAVPIGLFVLSQIEPVQNADGHLVRGLFWDVGRWEILADIVAPAWVLSIVAAAALNRRLLDGYRGDPEFTPKTWFGRRFVTAEWIRRSTWLATGGAVLIVALSWAREWARFGEQPEAFWYVLTIVVTLALLAIPLWWIRHDLQRGVGARVEASPAAIRLDRFLFDDESGPPRWRQALVFFGLIATAAIVVLGQLDGLLQGMHPAGEPASGIGSLASLFDLDLSAKRELIIERIGAWVEYGDVVGGAFASAYGVAVLSLLIDTFVLIPAYAIFVGILLLRARRSRHGDLVGGATATYDLLILGAFVVLAVTVVADLIENAVTWRAIWWGFQDLTRVDSWHARVIWFASATKTMGLALLVVAGILILALRRRRTVRFVQSLVAVRGELLVLMIVSAAVLMLPQVADVMRRWTVSVTLLTVLFATELAVLLQFTSSQTLRNLHVTARRVADGEEVHPATVQLPGDRERVSLRRLVVGSIFAMAALQVVLIGLLDLPVGLGFVIPCALIAILWLFGIPLPGAPFERGDRNASSTTRHYLPRFLGAAVFGVLGVTVIRAAVPELVYARHGDWWLLFVLLPLAIGLWRLHTRTGHTMGGIEAVVLLGVAAVGGWMIVVQGDPELSAVALAFTGFMLLFGSPAFFYSYSRESGPSRLAASKLQPFRVHPLVGIGLGIAVVVGAALLVFPLDVAPRIGSIAIILLGAMLLAAFAAAMVAFAERTRPPKILAAFRIRRTPVFVFLLGWLLLASVAATGASNDVPIIAGTERARSNEPVTVEDVWQRWVARNDLPNGGLAADDRQAVPLLFIASSGGGIRAAVWTSYVLDCIFSGDVAGTNGCPGTDLPDDATDRIAVMSGVSGGSFGLATFVGHLVDEGGPATDDWVKDRLDDDYLAAAMAWLLLVDTPRSFLGFGPRIRDRAEIMELAWEGSWDGDDVGFLSRGMFEVWEEEPEVPLMVFNGTSVNDPCRFNASVLDANAHDPTDTCTSLSVFENSTSALAPSAALAATQDLSDFLCPDQDIRVSTAALLTARFPIVSTSGRIGEGLAACDAAPRVSYVVDGGYLEGSAAGTVTELWDQFEPRVAAVNADAEAAVCIVPFLIQIDNGYENPEAGGSGASPRETLVPIAALLGSQFGRIAQAREQAAIDFDQPFMSAGHPINVVNADTGEEIASRYARVVTRAHPGIQAPLGWTLSNASMDDLRAQLLLEENQMELAEIARWLGGNLECITP
jgi:hypothetical protein